MPKRKPLRFNNYSGALSGAFLGWWAFLSFFLSFFCFQQMLGSVSRHNSKNTCSNYPKVE
jgi:ABC-type multidrug transport system permease subunit